MKRILAPLAAALAVGAFFALPAVSEARPGPFPATGAAPDLTTATGTLAIANGGTNSAAALSGSSILISNGTAEVQGAAGTTTTLLHGNAAGAPTYGAVVNADVSGAIAEAHGGTNQTTYARGDTLAASALNVLSKVTLGGSNTIFSSDGTDAKYQSLSTLGIAAKGANADITSLTALTGAVGDIAYFSALNTFGKLTVGGANTLLHGGASVPAYSAVVNADVSGTINETHGGTHQSTYTRGDVIYASAADTLSKKALCTSSQVYRSDGTDFICGQVTSSQTDSTIATAGANSNITSMTGVTKNAGVVQAASCSAGALALDPTNDIVEINANNAACVVTLGEANANVGRIVTMVITATPGAGLVTFPDVSNKHLGPTLCTTTGVGLGAVYTVYYAGTLLEYVGLSCEVNQ